MVEVSLWQRQAVVDKSARSKSNCVVFIVWLSVNRNKSPIKAIEVLLKKFIYLLIRLYFIKTK